MAIDGAMFAGSRVEVVKGTREGQAHKKVVAPDIAHLLALWAGAGLEIKRLDNGASAHIPNRRRAVGSRSQDLGSVCRPREGHDARLGVELWLELVLDGSRGAVVEDQLSIRAGRGKEVAVWRKANILDEASVRLVGQGVLVWDASVKVDRQVV